MGPAKLKIFDPGFIGSFFALIAAILAFLTLLTGVRPGDLLLFKVRPLSKASSPQWSLVNNLLTCVTGRRPELQGPGQAIILPAPRRH